jgi:hypothetical protein
MGVVVIEQDYIIVVYFRIFSRVEMFKASDFGYGVQNIAFGLPLFEFSK